MKLRLILAAATTLVLSTTAFTAPRKFYDAMLFEVRGHVKNMVTTTYNDVTVTKTVTFSPDGKLASDQKEHYSHDDNGHVDLILETSPGLLLYAEETTVNGSVEYVKIPASGGDFSYNYFPVRSDWTVAPIVDPDNGFILRTYLGDYEFFVDYHVTDVDSHGNWIRRELMTDGTPYGYQTRDIEYYPEDRTRQNYAVKPYRRIPTPAEGAIDFRPIRISINPVDLILKHFGWIDPSTDINTELVMLKNAGADNAEIYNNGYNRINDIEVVFNPEKSPGKLFSFPDSPLACNYFCFAVDTDRNGNRYVENYFHFEKTPGKKDPKALEKAKMFLNEAKDLILSQCAEGMDFTLKSSDDKGNEEWTLDTNGGSIMLELRDNYSKYYVLLGYYPR